MWHHACHVYQAAAPCVPRLTEPGGGGGGGAHNERNHTRTAARTGHAPAHLEQLVALVAHAPERLQHVGLLLVHLRVSEQLSALLYEQCSATDLLLGELRQRSSTQGGTLH